MTVSEMHRSFRFGLDKLDGLNYPGFEPEEIDLLLNQAQERFIKQRYGNNNLKRDSFEQTEKRTEDLRNIVQSARLAGLPLPPNGESIIYSSYMCPLPENHWFTIHERAILNCTTCNTTVKRGLGSIGDSGTATITGQYVEVRPVTHQEFERVIKDPFKGPDQTKILRLMYKNQVELVMPTTCQLLSYEFRYIRKPVTISLTGNVTCELSDHVINEVIDEAIKIALEGIEAKRTSTFTPIIDNQKE